MRNNVKQLAWAVCTMKAPPSGCRLAAGAPIGPAMPTWATANGSQPAGCTTSCPLSSSKRCTTWAGTAGGREERGKLPALCHPAVRILLPDAAERARLSLGRRPLWIHGSINCSPYDAGGGRPERLRDQRRRLFTRPPEYRHYYGGSEVGGDDLYGGPATLADGGVPPCSPQQLVLARETFSQVAQAGHRRVLLRQPDQTVRRHRRDQPNLSSRREDAQSRLLPQRPGRRRQRGGDGRATTRTSSAGLAVLGPNPSRPPYTPPQQDMPGYSLSTAPAIVSAPPMRRASTWQCATARCGRSITASIARRTAGWEPQGRTADRRQELLRGGTLAAILRAVAGPRYPNWLPKRLDANVQGRTRDLDELL